MTLSVLHTSYHVRSPLALVSRGYFSFSDFFFRLKGLLFSNRINSNLDPCVREGVFVDLHVGLGTIFWDKNKCACDLLSLNEQFSENGITGNSFLKEIALRSAMNAAVLDWLLVHPYEIPIRAWQGKKIFFWGTVYRSTNNNLYVRYLDCTGVYISESFFCLNCKLEGDMYALLLN